MGGEREDYVAKKDKNDKTETQDSVAGVAGKIRFHESAGQVHFHDDALKLKAAIPVADWWKAWDRLRTSLGSWTWIDTANDTVLTIETAQSGDYEGDGFQAVDLPYKGEPPGIEATISLTRGVFGTNFKALNAFTKRK